LETQNLEASEGIEQKETVEDSTGLSQQHLQDAACITIYTFLNGRIREIRPLI
jgi:hypothetical protein